MRGCINVSKNFNFYVDDCILLTRVPERKTSDFSLTHYLCVAIKAENIIYAATVEEYFKRC